MKRTYSEIAYDADSLNEMNPNQTMVNPHTKDEVVKTFCRIKPVNNSGTEKPLFQIKSNNLAENQILVVGEDNFVYKSFNFSYIFNSKSLQAEVFEKTCLPIISDLANGKSGLIFTYGLTNSGKTYTIVGDSENPGILPLCLKVIFNSYCNAGYSIYCSYFEIYNEDIFDLLSPNKSKVQIKERDKTFKLINITERKVNFLEDFTDALNIGIMKKIHASTNLNPNSSRSHCVFKIILRSQNEDSEASMSVVDLAGSERSYRSETTGRELQQACKINLSLSILGKCMETLRSNSIFTVKKIVPYRESRLTMVFSEYFQGDSNVTMITNINPVRDDFDETLRVLNYSCTAREIKPIKSRIITRKPFAFADNSLQSLQEEEKQALQINSLGNTYLLQEIETLKLDYFRLCRKNEETQFKFEELQRKNELLIKTYQELDYMQRLKELDNKVHITEKIVDKNWNLFQNVFKYLSNNQTSNDVLLPNPFYRDLNTNCQVEIKQNENLDTNRLIKVNDEADKSKSSTEKNMINENTCATSEETNKNQPLNNQDTDKETEDTPLHSHSIPNESKKDKKKTKKNNKKKKNQSLIPEEDVEERKSSKIREDPEDSNYEPLQENTVEEEEMSKPKKKTKGKGKSKKGKKK